eukprot:5117103-Prymnesium_polylepis.1
MGCRWRGHPNTGTGALGLRLRDRRFEWQKERGSDLLACGNVRGDGVCCGASRCKCRASSIRPRFLWGAEYGHAAQRVCASGPSPLAWTVTRPTCTTDALVDR